MNRYLNGVRLPTRKNLKCNLDLGLAGDDYTTQHGFNGTINNQAFTLSRLRREERLLQDDGVKVPDIDELSNEDDPTQKNKQLELVDEVYDNMNAFDMKLKSLKLVK
jgi:hypothetical protein